MLKMEPSIWLSAVERTKVMIGLNSRSGTRSEAIGLNWQCSRSDCMTCLIKIRAVE